MMRKRPASLPPVTPQPTVIIGFDSEWTHFQKGLNQVLEGELPACEC